MLPSARKKSKLAFSKEKKLQKGPHRYNEWQRGLLILNLGDDGKVVIHTYFPFLIFEADGGNKIFTKKCIEEAK